MNKLKFNSIEFILLLFAFNLYAEKIHTIKNKRIEVSVDNNGFLSSLKNLETGHNYAAGKPLWRLYFDRIEEKENEVLAANNIPEIFQEGNTIFIKYRALSCKNTKLNVTLTLKVILVENQVRCCSDI